MFFQRCYGGAAYPTPFCGHYRPGTGLAFFSAYDVTNASQHTGMTTDTASGERPTIATAVGVRISME
eukprot:scaffold73723_cov67-Attheya_sp.AAC.7